MSIFYDYPSDMEELNDLTEKVIGAAIAVHRVLGPGLLESAYESCLLYEVRKREIVVESQVSMPIFYDGNIIDAGYRIDMLVEHRLIVELKAVERIMPVHLAQLLSYLRLGGKQVGLLLNFNVPVLSNGIKRVILNQFDKGMADSTEDRPRPKPAHALPDMKKLDN